LIDTLSDFFVRLVVPSERQVDISVVALCKDNPFSCHASGFMAFAISAHYQAVDKKIALPIGRSFVISLNSSEECLGALLPPMVREIAKDESWRSVVLVP